MKKYFLSLVIALSLVIVPFAAHALGTATTPCANDGGVDPKIASLFPSKFCSANDLIVSVVSVILGIAAMVAVLFIVLGGFRYITSAGNDEQAKVGRAMLTNAIIGLVIIILAYTIVSVVAGAVKSAGDSGSTPPASTSSDRTGISPGTSTDPDGTFDPSCDPDLGPLPDSCS